MRLIRTAIDRGINFMDNSWDYNDGTSEERMGDALKDGYRNKVLLMTKIDGRSKASFNSQLEESLTRLKVDTLDLMQFHEIIRMEDPDRIFAAGGALEGALAAKQAGKIRYIGFTGHKDPAIHLRMFEVAKQHGFHFDTVQMPINVMDAHFRSFAKNVIPVAQAEGTGGAGDEGVCRPVDPAEQDGDCNGGAALLAGTAGFCGNHGDGFPAGSGSGVYGCADL